jgi:hypothetical protein
MIVEGMFGHRDRPCTVEVSLCMLALHLSLKIHSSLNCSNVPGKVVLHTHLPHMCCAMRMDSHKLWQAYLLD